MKKDIKQKLLLDIKKLYLEEQKHASEVSKILNISYGMVMYYVGTFNTTQSQYLMVKYPKKFLLKFIKNKTFIEASKELNLSLGRLRFLLKRYGFKRDTSTYYLKNKVNLKKLNKQYDKEFYYFAGLFASDGSYYGNKSIKISIKNKESLVLLTKIANFYGHNNIKQYKNGFNVISFCNEQLYQRLINIGIPRKSKTYSLVDIQVDSKETLLCLLLGLLDGDGSVGHQKSSLGYYTSITYQLNNYNKIFLKNIQLKLKEYLNIDSTVRKESKIFRLTVGTKKGAQYLFEEMYKISPFYLKCKFDIYYKIIHKIMI